jgi:hypothetical protein
MYGDRGLLETKLAEGYTEYSFVSGPWRDGARVVGAFLLYNKNGRVAALETTKQECPGGGTLRGPVFSTTYSPRQFKRHAKRWGLKSPKIRSSLAELLSIWDPEDNQTIEKYPSFLDEPYERPSPIDNFVDRLATFAKRFKNN